MWTREHLLSPAPRLTQSPTLWLLLADTANRLLRWGTILLNYNFELNYLPTNKIGHADGLSRLIANQNQPLEDSVTAVLRSDCEIKSIIANTVRDLPVTLSEIKNEALEDDFIYEIKRKIATNDNSVSDVYSL